MHITSLMHAWAALAGVASARVASVYADSVLANSNSDLIARDTTSPFAGKTMRMLPLGASITNGLHSTDGNGYRQDLLDLLTSADDAYYIGTQHSGTMKNNANEGHPGFVINQMEGVAAPDMDQRPNVILIYVGTNDMCGNDDLSNAPDRMGALIDYLHSKCDDALILAPKLFINAYKKCQANIDNFNKGLDAVVEARAKKGVHVMIADFSGALTDADLFQDGYHPNDNGYKSMAEVWYDTLTDAAAKEWINEPVNLTDSSTSKTSRTPAKASPPTITVTDVVTTFATIFATAVL